MLSERVADACNQWFTSYTVNFRRVLKFGAVGSGDCRTEVEKALTNVVALPISMFTCAMVGRRARTEISSGTGATFARGSYTY
ncbi:MAG TPA: hypothetical protein VKE71_11465 [Candidatus Angelobacter sp.]|nr:hypothetical protein [Candidatus Angelobacter sp.]